MALWSGRFKKGLHPRALKFSSSLDTDKQLYAEDIEGSTAHVEMLAKQKIITALEAKKIVRALQQIQGEIERGSLPLNSSPVKKDRFVAEDIHMAIEKRLIKKLGNAGGKLHTARSRNDQIALDERLYLRKAVKSIIKRIIVLQQVFIRKAGTYTAVIMPGYTHLQRGQPVLLAHHLLAYVSMFERDKSRFFNSLTRIEQSPLGAAAMGGTSFSIDRHFVAKKLGFQSIVENSIDAVSDRDILIECIAHCTIIMMHLSRFCEELVLWSSKEWNFIEIGDEFTTGSSIMPQKKNPDIAELIRGKTGRVYGDLMALLTVMKALPLAYNRDMQEDKEPLFDAMVTTDNCLELCALMLKTVRFNKNRFEVELNSDVLLATELADYLVRKGISFRSAHSIVGAIVGLCAERKIALNDFSVSEFKKFSKLFQKDVYDVLDARVSLSLKQSVGSTSPKEVKKALLSWKKKLRL